MSSLEERKAIVEKLIDQKSFDQAMGTVDHFLSANNLENKEHYTLIHLKGRVLHEKHSYNQVVDLIKPLLAEGVIIEDPVLNIDLILLISRTLVNTAQYQEGLEFLQQGEETERWIYSKSLLPCYAGCIRFVGHLCKYV